MPFNGPTELFHAVGAGKTAIMVVSSMKLQRFGLATKPAHVVPDHMLEQYTAEFVRLYRRTGARTTGSANPGISTSSFTALLHHRCRSSCGKRPVPKSDSRRPMGVAEHRVVCRSDWPTLCRASKDC